ncbi:hypothetical protein TFKS16_1379 [Tannerella forsythia KS16]|uniref:Uncharacterized protein n=1 Tax=Tannerella forsythia (strain ATCC 43037 / JCM 10827 / CCUG 21028 A / KCTC 5666 / FDC 338) TaxID=203275 RepID=G8UN20_TANFA|nr:hypothetical protein BFO_0743 [Tannerella forsythia 92A2]BAR51638.1 hypothetical protein TFKS16_1379 [Tannerella forsythia KS16]
MFFCFYYNRAYFIIVFIPAIVTCKGMDFFLFSLCRCFVFSGQSGKIPFR